MEYFAKKPASAAEAEVGLDFSVQLGKEKAAAGRAFVLREGESSTLSVHLRNRDAEAGLPMVIANVGIPGTECG